MGNYEEESTRVSVTCSPSGSGNGSSSKKLPVRPPLDLNTVKNQDGLSSDGDVLPLASFFLPVFRVAADIFSVVTRSYQVGRLAPDQGLARFADEVFDRTATNGADGEPRKLSPTIRPRLPDRTRP